MDAREAVSSQADDDEGNGNEMEKSANDPSLTRKTAEERIAVLKASSSAELLIRNAKAAWHERMKPKSIQDASQAVSLTSSAVDSGVKATKPAASATPDNGSDEVLYFAFPVPGDVSKVSEDAFAKLPSVEDLRQQLDDINRLDVEVNVGYETTAANLKQKAESNLGTADASLQTIASRDMNIAFMKSKNKELLKLILEAREQMGT